MKENKRSGAIFSRAKLPNQRVSQSYSLRGYTVNTALHLLVKVIHPHRGLPLGRLGGRGIIVAKSGSWLLELCPHGLVGKISRSVSKQ